MSMNLKTTVGAALLTLAVVGGVASYLSASLQVPAPKTVALEGIVHELSPNGPRHVEVIVTEGQAS